jgi:5-oxopent-3-ene-1,2,5-tricarboxylate decarboxylase / 2-hydroxyhepta-2,4-diene-1,7-dioate isomerase
VNTQRVHMPRGTVYGVLMNTDSEWQALAPAMHQAPYQQEPQAPVLYIKTANTYSASGSTVYLPADVPEVALGATFLMAFEPLARTNNAQAAIKTIANDLFKFWRLTLDISVPHTSFYRPPVKHNCRDGFLGLGTPVAGSTDNALPAIELLINGQVVQRIDWQGLRRKPAQLLADVLEFTQLQAGDELMTGTAFHKPLARVGDVLELRAAGHAPLTITLAAA